MTGILHDYMGASRDAASVTPSDSADLANYSQAIRANTSGTIKITTAADNPVTLNFLAGETRYIIAKRIWATGTTCTGIEIQY